MTWSDEEDGPAAGNGRFATALYAAAAVVALCAVGLAAALVLGRDANPPASPPVAAHAPAPTPGAPLGGPAAKATEAPPTAPEPAVAETPGTAPTPPAPPATTAPPSESAAAAPVPTPAPTPGPAAAVPPPATPATAAAPAPAAPVSSPPAAEALALPPDTNITRLAWALSRTTGYVGVLNHMGSRFTTSREAMLPVLGTLKQRGLMFVDARTSARSGGVQVAGELGLPRAINDRFLDAGEKSRVSIDARLAEVERIAREVSASLAIGQGYPVTIERVRIWSQGMPAKGIVLVPATALIGRQADR